MQKLLLFSILFVLGATLQLNAQAFPGLDKSPTDISYARPSRTAIPDIKVVYSRPQKKGRKVFGNLVPYGRVWRTGADESTEIKFFQDMKFGENVIKAGTYSLFTIPGEKEWTIILNTDLDTWGSYSYDDRKDVARIKVPVQKESGGELEFFSIAFSKNDNGYDMYLAWDSTTIKVPFNFQR